MDLKPGTPEYDEAYQKEMQRLEAEAGKKDAKADDKPAESTSEVKADDKKEAKADDQKAETDAELKARLEKVEKALKDTQRWGHQNATEVARLKKEAQERSRKEAFAEDPVLKANPGLEETIKRVAGKEERQEPQETWLSTVAQAIPDVNDLLGDKDFYAKAAARKSELGVEWDNPLSAIRELSNLKAQHVAEKTSQSAVAAARKDFESKSKKRSAMEVPGGSGGKDASTQTQMDEAKRIQNMPKADFDKLRSKVMGF